MVIVALVYHMFIPFHSFILVQPILDDINSLISSVLADDDIHITVTVQVSDAKAERFGAKGSDKMLGPESTMISRILIPGAIVAVIPSIDDIRPAMDPPR